MRRPIHWLLPSIAVAVLGVAWAMPAVARDGEPRDAQRAVRDLERAQARELEDLAREQEDLAKEQADQLERASSNSGSGSGSDDSSGSDDDAEKSPDHSGRRGLRFEVERNAPGGDRQRDEVLLIGAAETIAAVRQAGHTLRSERALDSLRQVMITVQVREGETIEQLIDALRRIAPGARIAPNHIFRPSAVPPAQQTVSAPGVRAIAPAVTGGNIDIGVIDTGADPAQPRLQQRLLSYRGFGPGGYRARAHGTAVAQLAASQQARIAVADVFGLDRRNQLVAPAELIAAAIDWMLALQAPVLNISIEGPQNAVLAYVVESAVARGVVIVAAVGNGGPAAAPSYPAAYPGVVAVTALDANGQIYRRAARGAHVQFAARGSYSANQTMVATQEKLAGTSFAAPVVAAEISRRWRDRPLDAGEQVLARMRADCTDLGKPGRDPVYGWGSVNPQHPVTATR
jgi:minor extracellular protease Epr